MNDDLIARLERATEGSRELDFEIAEYLDKIGVKYATTIEGHTPEWTQSLDAALSLVPEPKKLAWGVGTMKRDGDPKITYAANCRRFGRIDAGQPLFDAEAATPALALCVAALRARG